MPEVEYRTETDAVEENLILGTHNCNVAMSVNNGQQNQCNKKSMRLMN